jgi:hypothetical protein
LSGKLRNLLGILKRCETYLHAAYDNTQPGPAWSFGNRP